MNKYERGMHKNNDESTSPGSTEFQLNFALIIRSDVCSEVVSRFKIDAHCSFDLHEKFVNGTRSLLRNLHSKSHVSENCIYIVFFFNTLNNRTLG